MSTDSEQLRSTVKQKREQIKLQQNWVYEANKLKKRYDVIEKQLQSIYRDGNPLSLEFKDIFDWKQLMHSERNKQSKDLQNSLISTSNLVNKFQSLLSNPNNTQQFLNQMNGIADQIEDKLMKFKTNHQQQLKELENAENILWTELCTTTERLDTFEKDINLNNINSEQSSSKPTPKFAKKRTLNEPNRFGRNENDSRPQKLIDVQRQIDEHGRNGGWPQRDHQDFLKLYSQITNDKELLHRLCEVMPQYTLSELREHLTWFDQHERLWEYKRKIIAEWKQEKKKKQKLKAKVVERYDKTQKNEEKKIKEQLKKERERKKQMVREWREQKEQEEEEQMRIKQEALKQKELRQKQIHRERVREQKKLLLELQEKKKLNALVAKTVEPNKNLKVMKNSERNKKLLMKFRTKDMLLVTKKKEAINKKQQKERDREWRLVNLIAKSQPDIKVKNDKERLLKQTAATKKRMEEKKKEKGKGENKDGRCFGYTENASRSVPSWRQGL